MTEFQALNISAFGESIAVTGATAFRLRGMDREGSITDLTEEEKYEIGQVVAKAVATMEFAAEQFTPPLVNGEKISLARNGITKVLRIGHIEADEVSIRLTLADPNE